MPPINELEKAETREETSYVTRYNMLIRETYHDQLHDRHSAG